MRTKSRNGFKKLLDNVKMNGLSRDSNGEFTVINSSTNKKRMEGHASGLWWGSNPKSKRWIPNKIYIVENDLVDIWNKQNRLCYWFKIPLDFDLLFNDYVHYYPKHPLAPSVDRIDDKLDYTKDNVIICCRLANFGRNIYPFDDFHEVIKIVTHERVTPTLMEFIE